MTGVKVLIELSRPTAGAFDAFAEWARLPSTAVDAIAKRLPKIPGLQLDETQPPVPMFGPRPPSLFKSFAQLRPPSIDEHPERADLTARSTVMRATVDPSALEWARGRAGVRIWPNSDVRFFARRRAVKRSTKRSAGRTTAVAAVTPFDAADSGGGVDCAFKPPVDLDTIRELLGVQRVWSDGFRGQNVVVGILDGGVSGAVYPVVGGFSTANGPKPGKSRVSGHGSMCAAAVMVAAPQAKLYDYPFIDVPDSGGALTMFQAVLDQRRRDGTPQIVSNSWGYTVRPPQAQSPHHETWDLDHPLNRKVGEVVASGASVFFAAGNCGSDCQDPACDASVVGPNASINGPASLAEVITVAAVNSENERLGYSGQGPGCFEKRKPNLAGYARYLGNYGPGRPAGDGDHDCDDGTSAACPLVAGVAALLLSACDVSADRLRDALTGSAVDIGAPGRDFDTGFGVINAAAAYARLRGG